MFKHAKNNIQKFPHDRHKCRHKQCFSKRTLSALHKESLHFNEELNWCAEDVKPTKAATSSAFLNSFMSESSDKRSRHF